jgi:hypothetical protein
VSGDARLDCLSRRFWVQEPSRLEVEFARRHELSLSQVRSMLGAGVIRYGTVLRGDDLVRELAWVEGLDRDSGVAATRAIQRCWTMA